MPHPQRKRLPEPKITVLWDQIGVEQMTASVESADIVSFDTETTGVQHSDRIIGFSICVNEDEAFYVVLDKWDKETKTLIPVQDRFFWQEWLGKHLKGKRIIGHNVSFDCWMTDNNFHVLLIDDIHTDTMVLAHLLDENREIGLKALCYQYFGESAIKEQKLMKESIIANGGVVTKKNLELYKADAELIAHYGAKDAFLTLMLFYELIPELIDQGLEKFFYEDECMPLLRGPTYELNTSGLMIDQPKIMALQKQLEVELAELKGFIYEEIAPLVKDRYPGTKKTNTFNIDSPSQRSWLLFGKLELEFGTLTQSGKDVCKFLGLRLPYTYSAKREFIDLVLSSVGSTYGISDKGKPQKIKEPWSYIKTDKETLGKYKEKLKWVEALLTYNKKLKLLNTYVIGIQERLRYGVIRPSFLQTGTTSGRYASRNPNFQNLPRSDKRIKDCVMARPGKVFVGADYSQLEPRCFASASKDPRLCAAFNGADDFYSTIGIETFDKYDATPQKEGSPNAFGVKYSALRDQSKAFALAATYGATTPKLATLIRKSKEDTQDTVDRYFEKFPKVKEMMLLQHAKAKKDGVVYNFYGRPRRMPEAKLIAKRYGDTDHAELPYEARKLLNLGVNHYIQGTAASIVNRAAIKFHSDKTEAGIDCKLVLQVHDQLVVECRTEDADNVAILLQNAMETAIELPLVPLEAVPKIAPTLAGA